MEGVCIKNYPTRSSTKPHHSYLQQAYIGIQKGLGISLFLSHRHFSQMAHTNQFDPKIHKIFLLNLGRRL
uniref:Uncharacterized protein n=1 Tax=Rhizophora mucronata TaxID=61149 RepID=A0A2P2P3N7_RHIMU